MNSSSNEKVSVVIATLGGDSLHETIRSLNSGTIVPKEIIISIPEEYESNLKGLRYENVEVLKVPVKGQVAQRALGFMKVSCEFVLQLDDDILLDKGCLEKLIQTLKSNGSKVVVGAAIYELSSNKPVYKKVSKGGFLQKVYYWLLNGKDGYVQGIVDKAGVNIGVDYSTTDINDINVEWLAGGCVAHYKENLILDNFYPFKGKAYSEDLIHSYLLSSSGCRLITNKNAKCYIDVLYSKDMSFIEYWRNLKGDYRARSYYVKLSGKSFFRMNFYYMAWFLSYLFKFIRK